MTSRGKSLGVTPHLSTELPTEDETRANESLIVELRRRNNFESAAETEKRYARIPSERMPRFQQWRGLLTLGTRKLVLKQIENIGHEFVRRVAREKEGHNQKLVKDAICRVFTYGSYRLGVHSPGSDIDTLVIAPKYCTLKDFFKHMSCCLRELSPPGAIISLAEVPDAFVPIIKMVYSGIEIDLIFTRMATLKQLPADPGWSMQDHNLLRGLNDIEVRAVNGARVNDEILTLVPEPSTFRLALRAIKLWAQNRAVYGNIVGFPGGIAWALMVARVCQLLPMAPSSVVVSKFFGVLEKWPWPQPVILKPVESGPLNLSVWNPKGNKRDAAALMPVITPTYPSMNTTFNISWSTFTVLRKELDRAKEISAQIMEEKRSWNDLFEKHTFFTHDYRHYLHVTTIGLTKEDLKMWSGWVESRLRLLVQSLEKNPAIKLAHPFVKGFSRKHQCFSDDDIAQVQNGSMAYLVEDSDVDKDDIKLAGGAKKDKVTETTADFKTEDGEDVKEKNGEPIDEAKHMPLPAKDEAQVKSTVKTAIPTPNSFHVFSKTFYIGLEVEIPEGHNGLEMAREVETFKNRCSDWDMYTNRLIRTCGVSILSIRK